MHLSRSLTRFIKDRRLIAQNAPLRGRHAGERCFILCNGPSVNEQDIRPLRDEIVFSVSNGYLHRDYGILRPRYHCVPQLTYIHLTKEMAVAWFREMDAALGGAELFLSADEYELVSSNDLFPGRVIRYLRFGRRGFQSRSDQIPDIARGTVPRPTTVPIMTLMIALYMGFTNIHLIGTEHDWFVRREYNYFFDRSRLPWKDLGITLDGKVESPLVEDLAYALAVWRQYAALKAIASAAGVTILNATRGGMLDVFDRINLEDAIASRPIHQRP